MHLDKLLACRRECLCATWLIDVAARGPWKHIAATGSGDERSEGRGARAKRGILGGELSRDAPRARYSRNGIGLCRVAAILIADLVDLDERN